LLELDRIHEGPHQQHPPTLLGGGARHRQPVGIEATAVIDHPDVATVIADAAGHLVVITRLGMIQGVGAALGDGQRDVTTILRLDAEHLHRSIQDPSYYRNAQLVPRQREPKSDLHFSGLQTHGEVLDHRVS